MKQPVHQIKKLIAYADGREPHWTIQSRIGWLGSDVKDINGKEIFEGDIVTFGVHRFTVCWHEGEFILCAPNKPAEPLNNFFSEDECQLEVVGHVAEDIT